MKKLSLVLFVLVSFNISVQKTYIHCEKLIDAISNVPLSAKKIIIDGNKIIAIEDGYETPGNGDNLIDLKNKIVLSGLIYMYVNLELQTNRDALAGYFSNGKSSICDEGRENL